MDRFSISNMVQADIDIMSLLQRARSRPLETLMEDALVKAWSKLSSEARTCGETRYRRHSMNMTVYVMVQTPLVFEYGVHDNAQVVVIRRIFRLGTSLPTDGE